MEYQAVAFTFVKRGIFCFARKAPNDHYTSGKTVFLPERVAFKRIGILEP
jgi:hypothetical protein